MNARIVRRESRFNFVRPVAAAVLCAMAFGAVGCSGRVHSYRLNPTPGLWTTSQTGDEVANATTKTFNTNKHLLIEDLARLTMVDRPSRLQRRPKPY